MLTVTAQVSLIQSTTGERSFTVNTNQVANLPLANRSYDALLALAPGVNSTPGALTPATRLGDPGGRQLHARRRDSDGPRRQSSGDTRQR